MKSFIVVLPYQETARFLTATKATTQESFLGENGKAAYHQSEAKAFSNKADATAAMENYGNTPLSHVKEVDTYTTLSLEEIQDRLRQSFEKVEKFSQFDSKIINAPSVTSRQVSVINYKGLKMGIGIYTIGTEKEIENDTAKWFRFVEFFGLNKAYYF